MRVTVVVYGSLEHVSGGFAYDRQLVSELSAAGHNVSVYSLPWRRYAGCLLQNAMPALPRRLLQAAPDLIVQDELCHPSLIRANRVLQHDGPPIVSVVHHLRSRELHSPLIRWLYALVERTYLASVDGFIFNSIDTRESVERLLRRDTSGVVAYPGRSGELPAIRPPASDPSRPLQILYVGSLSRRKGIIDLLAAVRQLPEDMCRLRIVGRTDVEPDIAQVVIAEAGVLKQVELLGPASPETLATAFTECDLVAVPSSLEGFGIVYLEAMTYGKPVLGTAVGGAAELIEDGATGFLIPPGNREVLKHRIQQYAEDRSLLHRHGMTARTRAERHPTWKDSARTAIEYLVLSAYANQADRSNPLLDQPNVKRSTP